MAMCLYLGLHAVAITLFVQIGARRRQQSNIAAYLLVFAEGEGGEWERRLRLSRERHGRLPVDRWYAWGEGVFLVLIITIAAIGSLINADLARWLAIQSIERERPDSID